MGREPGRDLAEKGGRGREIECGIARSQARAERPVGRIVGEVPPQICDPPSELLPAGIAGVDELGQ